MNDSHPLLCTPEEGADELRLSRATVYRLLASGELESVKCGRSRRIPRQALEDFVERLRSRAAS